MKFLKQRWVIAVLAIAATALVIFVVLPKLKMAKKKDTTNPVPPATIPSTATGTAQRLVGAVQYAPN